MKEYHKIESVFVRDEKTHKFIEGAWRLSEFEYLKDAEWICEEKIDGTNIRVLWDGSEVRFGGKTDNAQLYVPLLDRLRVLFPAEKLAEVFQPKEDGSPSDVCLYGEGFGVRIQKGGGNYISDGVDFALFDVRVGAWWLKRESVAGIAGRLGTSAAPQVLVSATLADAVEMTRHGFPSRWGPFPAEGLVCRPAVDLFARNGDRIITKIKTKDFA